MYKESVQDRHNLTKKKGIIEYGGGGIMKMEAAILLLRVAVGGAWKTYG